MKNPLMQTRFRHHQFLVSLVILLCGSSAIVAAQNQTEPDRPDTDDEDYVPEQVDVQPAAADTEIQERILRIMTSTGWFTDAEVDVNDGVVFLHGGTDSNEYKRWAGDLARSTQDVTAVVNQIEVMEPDIWNYEPAITGMRELWFNLVGSIPFWVFGLIVLILFWGISILVAKFTRRTLQERKMNRLLQDITARTVAVLVFLAGVYIVFHIADLTNIAITVLGGTGLLGIILGIAFREITENFLASIFLSLQNPFRTGDLVEIGDKTGYVERLTVRATLLMTLDGNHLQIPNSTVYKADIQNFTSNPIQRDDFLIGIDYQDSITEAQEIAARVLEEHPAVLKEPEPLILAEELAASSVHLHLYFWMDANRHHMLKVKSSIMRLVKTAYQQAGITIPDEAREMIFPEGVPVVIRNGSAVKSKTDQQKETDRSSSDPVEKRRQAPEEVPDDSQISTDPEGQLERNQDEIREQVRKSRPPEPGRDLLDS